MSDVKKDRLESPDEKIQRLEKEAADLRAKLQLAEETVEQRDAQLAASLMFGSTVHEVPCGTREVEKRDKYNRILYHKVPRLDGDGEQEKDDEGKKLFDREPVMVEVPVYKYKIDLPPSGGVSVTVNGECFYHGQVYEFTLDEVRTIKEIMARSWVHEASILGKHNENAYRKPSEIRLGMQGGRVVQSSH